MVVGMSMVVFLYSYSSAHPHVRHHSRMHLFSFALLLRFDKKLFYRFFTTVIFQLMTKMLRLQL